MSLKYKELSRRVLMEGIGPTVDHLKLALADGDLNPRDFNIRDLAESLVFTRDGSPCGREWVNNVCNPHKGGGVVLLEADGAVDSTAFSNITGQIVFSEVMKGYEQPEFIYPKIARTYPSKFITEKIPGLTGISEDMDDDIQEGMQFPAVGFGEDYIETPKTVKKGRLINITKEAVFYDRTGLILDAARSVGELLGLRREKMACDVLAGITNNFKWKGTTYNTYQTSAPWINVKATNGLVAATGWQQVDAAEQLFTDMLDPHTGEPITVSPKSIITVPARKHTFRRVFAATNVKSSQATTSSHDGIDGPNTLDPYDLTFSKFLYRRIIASGVSAANAADWWFLGDFQRAFAWIENFPMAVLQAPVNSEAEFNQDIVARYRASMKGVYAVMEPRAAEKNYQA